MYAIRSYYVQERMIAKTSNTTRLVDKLLLKELVTREVCPENRRKMEIEITDRITSYNVCYTKLLRTLTLKLRLAVRWFSTRWLPCSN